MKPFSLWMLTVSVRIYRWLLWIYPPSFRWEYGGLMVQLFHDMGRDAIQKRGILGLVSLWGCVFWELGETVRQQSLEAGYFFSSKLIFSTLSVGVIAILLLVGYFYLSPL